MKCILLISAAMVVMNACSGVAGTAIPTMPPPAVSYTSAATTRNTPANTPSQTTEPTNPGNSGSAPIFPDPNSFTWAPVASGIFLPTDIQFPDDGSGRMFVLEQAGRILVFQQGQSAGSVLLDITGEVGSAGSEQGLLGLAFHPDFKHNPYLYVNYTDVQGNTVIARFKADGDLADPASEKALMHIQQPFPNHNGGAMLFGPDGYLYLGLGDGGSAGDPLGNGQNTQVLLGKLLRIDVDRGDPYGIPPDNPFVKGGGRLEAWAYGLRNPWRVSFDRLTHDLYIADVGQDTWEEVDFLPAGTPGGSNFGWNYREANHPYSNAVPPAGLTMVSPVAEYSHAEGDCSITGGFVYRGHLTEWQGIYLYGDYCSGRIRGLTRSGAAGNSSTWFSQLLFETGAHITTFGQDPSGEVFFADRGGTIYELQKR
jgi:glucose/arabinose dehydrogenase